MGLKGVYTYLKHYRKELDLEAIGGAPLRIGVDAMSLLYRFRGDEATILGLVKRLRDKGHKVFFVFDGKPPPEKEREVAARRGAKEEAATAAASIQSFLDSDAAAELSARDRELLELTLLRHKSSAWHMTRESRRAFQDKLWDAAVPYVKSLSEADDVLIDLSAAGKLDVLLSTDMDVLLGGIAALWVPTQKGTRDAPHIEELCVADILEGEGLIPASFYDACLLCGTEERKAFRGVPPETAFAWMRHYGCLEALVARNKDVRVKAMFPDGLASIKEVRAARAAAAEPYGRIRPDHLERVKEFLDGL